MNPRPCCGAHRFRFASTWRQGIADPAEVTWADQSARLLAMSDTPNAAVPGTTIELRSTVTEDGVVTLGLRQGEVPAPGPAEVVVRVEAAPINPSDLGMLFAGANTANAGFRIVAPGEKLRPGGGTDSANIEVIQDGALFSDGVDVRRGEISIAVDTEIAPSLIVGQEDDHIGRFGSISRYG